MKAEFRVRVLEFRILQEIGGVWTTADFASLLEYMEFGETTAMSDTEVREVALLALQDLGPVAAAELVLTKRLGNRLKAGQIRNAANEMLDEKLWEEHADLSLHEGMFNVGSLLYAAFPQVFPQPDAVQVTLEVSATNEASQHMLAGPLHESFLVRLLADGMDDSSVLHRIFDEQLDGKSFPEADRVVWILRVDSSNAPTVVIQVTSSGYWLDPLRGTRSYESSAYPDGVDGKNPHDACA